MVLQKRFYISSTAKAVNQGTSIPTWLNNYNIDNWWYDGDSLTAYFYSVNQDSIYIQYGQNLSNSDIVWASGRFFGETVTINTENENSDGSVTANVTVTPNFFSIRRSDYATTGLSVVYTISINNIVVYSYTGTTTDEITNGQGIPQTFNVTVLPQQEITSTALSINIRYPNGEYPESTTSTGFSLYNPTPPSYKPFSSRKNNQWKDFDSNQGFINIRKNGIWTDTSNESTLTAYQVNQGHNRIRKNGEWLQAPKMIGGTST